MSATRAQPRSTATSPPSRTRSLGGAAAHDDPSARELQELALALRADAPEPDPEFARELRTRVEAGFPPAPGSLGAARASLRERFRPAR